MSDGGGGIVIKSEVHASKDDEEPSSLESEGNSSEATRTETAEELLMDQHSV